MRAIFERAARPGVPVIHFGTGTGHLLAVQREAGGDVIGLDWRTPLDEGWARSGTARPCRGTSTPPLLFAPRERLLARVDDVLRRAGGRPGHVFNLGHGILPGTPVENVKAVVDHVHAKHGGRERMKAVLLLAHGTPESLDEMPEYLRACAAAVRRRPS